MSVCANPACDNPLPARVATGRPAIYCSPACRQRRHPSTGDRTTNTPPSSPPAAIVVELDHPDQSPDGRPAERVWTLRLRHGQHSVTIAEGLGWPTANALARQLDDLLAAQATRPAPRPNP